MTEERQLKGINFIGTLDAFERKHGAQMRRRLEAEVDEPVRRALAHGEILASGWYPAHWYDALLRKIVDLTHGDARTARELSCAAVENDLKTLFKVMRLFISPQKALSQSMRMSRRYIDGGEIEVVEAETERVQYRFREYRGYTRLMWWDFIGGIEGVLRSMGCQDVTARVIAGGNDGDHHLELLMRWRT